MAEELQTAPSDRELAGFPVPAKPQGNWISTLNIPAWVRPLSNSISHGGGAPEAINGIGFSQTGDLLLYRKLSREDYDRFPLLEGVAEVWIDYEMKWEE